MNTRLPHLLRISRFRLAAALAIAAVFGLLPPTASAMPAQIIFIRHAEKPKKGPELNERGWQRAAALPALFTNDPRALEHGPVVAIYAGAPVKEGGSVRAIQTSRATAKALGVPLIESINRDQVPELVRAISDSPAYEGKTVLVCWEHKKIPQMLKAFGWTDGPKKWQDDVYDRLWVLDFKGGEPVRFRDEPQKLLPGDSAQ